MRSHPPPEASGNTIGLEAIIRKALMGNLEEQMDDRSPSGSLNSINVGVPPAGMSAGSADGRSEDTYSLPGAPCPFPPITSSQSILSTWDCTSRVGFKVFPQEGLRPIERD